MVGYLSMQMFPHQQPSGFHTGSATVVMRGLDPRIHAEGKKFEAVPKGRASDAAAWIAGP
jgi:hypothetical protein